jgi:acetyl esterase/lipase
MGTTKRTITYDAPGGEPLAADLYIPEASAPAPVLICIHGGAWKRGTRLSYGSLGPYLAAAGYLVASIDYRLVTGTANRYPAALDDVRAAIRYVRDHAAELNADVDRIGLMGDSAGGHLAALTGLTDAARIKAIVGVFGVYDCAAQWRADLGTLPGANFTEEFLGVPLSADRRLYFDASPISYAIAANNTPAMLLAWGTEDDVVLPQQSEDFLLALKHAGFFVRTIVQAAPHYWVGDPLDEPGSYSAFLAPRLRRFLDERLAI